MFLTGRTSLDFADNNKPFGYSRNWSQIDKMMETERNLSLSILLAENLTPKSNQNHRQRKACIRKERRKQKRQAVAKARDKKLEEEEEAKKNSPSYLAKLRQEEDRVKAEILWLEAESKRQRELWEWSEEIYKEKLRKKQEQEERERLNRLEIERKIKEEWEERQKKEKEEEERQKKKKEKQEELLRQAREGENKESDWHNPLAPVQYGQERVVNSCPFFAKVGACRFGDRCSRAHAYPDTGKTILFTNMFRHFQLDQGLCEEYDTDIVLEYEDSEVYQRFSEFFEDTLPEFKAAGQVTQFKVCCNFQPHLRGNVYVSYSRDEDALKAYSQFNARWYGGKQLSGQFVDIPSWKRAICGLFGKGCCPKGRECNFLHVFKNPTNEFVFADRDMEYFNNRNRNDRHTNRFDKHSFTNRSRRYSRSPSRSHRKHRSRSSDRYRSSSRRSHSNDRKYNRDYRRRSGRSRHSRSRSRDRDYSRSRSKSRERRHSRSRSRDRKYSRSRSREREYSRSKTSRRPRSKTRDNNYARSEKMKRSRSKSNSTSPERQERSQSRSVSPGKESERFVDKRSRSNERVDNNKTEVSSKNRKNDHYRSHSPSHKHHKSKKRKWEDRKRQRRDASGDDDSDFEEVWVEKTNNVRKN